MLTVQIVPYSDIENLSSLGRIRKLLNLAKEDKLVLLQGKLKKEEEAELIKATMEEINREFKGIELAIMDSTSNDLTGFNKIKSDLLNAVLGNRQGLTVIGPANIVKKIKQDPNNLQVIIEDSKKRKRRNPAKRKTKKRKK